MAASRKDWLHMAPPPNYVAGLGRGATGFTTRSDIGPAREGPSEDLIKAALARRLEGGADNDDDDERFRDPENDVGLFGSAPYDEEDDEADKIFDAVDQKMDLRRKAKREAREAEAAALLESKKPKIQSQFADLKRGLSVVTDEEWANIPEVTNISGRNKRKTVDPLRQRYYAVPDSLLAEARDMGAMDTSIETNGAESVVDGTMTDFASIGKARDTVLGMKLDQAGGDSVSGSTTIDPKGYLTSLSSVVTKSSAEIGDLKRARLLYQSVTQTNPKHAPGWIAAARVEEMAGKTVPARNIIAKGCEECPTNEDVWIERVRLNTEENGKVIIAEAVRAIPKSVKLWLTAMRLETEDHAKRRVLRKALEFIPQSVKLWKEAVDLEENPNNARILLARATELIPLSVDLWLALARLETPENARKVLNKARQAVPTSHEIWIAAARLEEESGRYERLGTIIQRAISELQKFGGMLSRENWITEAERCEQEGGQITCQEIIAATLGQGVEDEDRKTTWLADAEASINRGCYMTARAIYAYALRVFPEKKGIWRRAVELEKNHGTTQALSDLLEHAVQRCPKAEILWLIHAKEKYQVGDIDATRSILARAFEENSNSEEIWLAAVKVEFENHKHEDARILLRQARTEAGTERVWRKSVMLERHLNEPLKALELVDEGLRLFERAEKLHMMKSQIFEELGKIQNAREAFTTGTRKCSSCVTLWILASRLEEKAGLVIKARALLDRARLINQNNEELWCETIQVELRAKNDKQAKIWMAKALQECPKSGNLWSAAIFMEPRPQRKTRSVDALRACDSDSVLITTVSRLFWAERKIDKAKTWFERAVTVNPDNGDSWAWYYNFLKAHGSEEEQSNLVNRAVAADPHHGKVWQVVAKDINHPLRKAEDILTEAAKLVADQ
ncbi:Pre-mRNA-splicing factor prp1 [Neolecta irregularis DAH-3]|uniref:Pre-mRNA-splicing factor prp1 n=1 Tax=Neolecta irregularis (strain DAH-3) TaxID=1198029 RepID=A0A1U7LQA5_NEOID|nr:Pre-mRNA-splicing factor prp1 [Neolecta irregularis DAH-3]|eukprot:OLL24837.1 Pre-mRNA-splicing factor prp1 [Neolecta irregularis DAH-3]